MCLSELPGGRDREEYFDRYGNCCLSCDRWASRCANSRINKNFLRGLWWKAIIRSINNFVKSAIHSS